MYASHIGEKGMSHRSWISVDPIKVYFNILRNFLVRLVEQRTRTALGCPLCSQSLEVPYRLPTTPPLFRSNAGDHFCKVYTKKLPLCLAQREADMFCYPFILLWYLQDQYRAGAKEDGETTAQNDVKSTSTIWLRDPALGWLVNHRSTYGER